MGQDESRPISPSIPPRQLKSRSIESVAHYILNRPVSKVVVLTGAGISTSAGIPDFRSPETGLYANLSRLNLPYAEAVFDIAYFRQNPEPFYTLAAELYPGKFRPTLAHSFIRLLADKGLLLKLFTQNIDCLEREAGVPGDLIVEAHGSFAEQSCIECKLFYDKDEIRKHVAAKTIPRCPSCDGLVKPEIVFFGEQLPAAFFANRMLPVEADLVIVMGTSLTVQPFASLPQLAREDAVRVLINKEVVGGLGSRADDVVVLEDCDEGVRQLAKALGWLNDLEALWAETRPAREQEVNQTEFTKDEKLEREIDKLTKEVDETLNLSKWQDEKVRGDVLPSVKQDTAKGPATVKATAVNDTAIHAVAVPGQTPHEDEKGDLGHVFPASKPSNTSDDKH
ncbi:NAD-dependent protein deacetylase hst2-1 [Cryoendolithus antarcticus]|uniref:NAD-dependent protein deacetylase hst2-1 n=1 Tax=Cryoendolithus antarcticus TaxID=1507870 RepID=A0A1V8SJ80_9PEZI|nr:NAD-dependent protein deacetylase hst2-1 [Cryoendolithus antarcticus]